MLRLGIGNVFLIAQCPCSGGGTGDGMHPLVIVAFLVALWAMTHWAVSVWKKEGAVLMNKAGKIGVVVALVLAVGVALVLKGRGGHDKASHESTANAASETTPTSQQADKATDGPTAKAGLPRLVDLGAGKCIPCKMMAPILEELKKEYAGRLEVVFIDVWENQQAGAQYGIRVIPTQIFFDAAGKERFRHEGFMSKQDILGKWAELGIELKGP